MSDESTYYDPTGFDRDEWLPKLLCRVGRCGKPVAPGSTFCRPHQLDDDMFDDAFSKFARKGRSDGK